MSTRQMTRAEANEYYSQMTAYDQELFARATPAQKMAMLLYYADMAASPTSTGSPGSPFDYDDESGVAQTDFRSSRRGYVCIVCGQISTRQGDLDRHLKTHNPSREKYDCPISGCNRVGSNGLPRRDKARDHVKDKHKVSLPRGFVFSRSSDE